MDFKNNRSIVPEAGIQLRPIPSSYDGGLRGSSKTNPLDSPLSSLPNLSRIPTETTTLSPRAANPSLHNTPLAEPTRTSSFIQPNDADGEITKLQRRKGRLHFAAVCWCLFLNGWNDGSSGPLIPSMQQNYNIGFTIVSLIFVVNCIGFLTGAVLNVWLTDKLGFGKVVVLGAFCQTITYAIQSPAPPYPLFALSYLFSGFGISLQNASCNGFVGSLANSVETKLGFLHASYGLGAFASPLLATYFSKTDRWSFHYLVSVCLSATNLATLSLVFRFKSQEAIQADAGQPPAASHDDASGNKYRQLVRFKSVHLLALFALLYVGIEVTIGGWIVTFVMEERNAGSQAGYLSSGFFGGLTLGRICLLWLNKLMGEQRVIYVYSLLAIALELTIWLVPSMIENALAVSFIGFFMGPMFPIIMSSAKVLPRWLLTGAMGWIGGIGMAGSAALPFITGVLAGKFGIHVLQPFIVSMMSVMIGVWALVPKAPRRVD